MEINFDTIIKYLNPESLLINNDITDVIVGKNIITKLADTSDLNDTFYKIGVVNKINIINNKVHKLVDISFFSSILTLLDKTYITHSNTDEEIIIKNFINTIKTMILNSSFKFELNVKFPKPILVDRIIESSFNDGLIYQVIVQLLNINLIIFSKDNIQTCFYGHSFNPWKPILLLNKNENYFEPIMNDEKSLFSYNDKVIQDLIMNKYSSIKYFNSEYLNKEFSFTDEFTQLLDEFILENQPKTEPKPKTESKTESKTEPNTEPNTEPKSEPITEPITEPNTEPNTESFIETKYYNKTNLKSMKKEDIVSMIEYNKVMFKTFTQAKARLITKNELIDKFLFFQTTYKKSLKQK